MSDVVFVMISDFVVGAEADCHNERNFLDSFFCCSYMMLVVVGDMASWSARC